ncbi:hypothetical protein [Streptomyces flavidovirens]|uniref:Uncharacterized protein n=1 Tax=Streptomyces flavidovirens TaxID=67298 RepID=A0ABW6RMF0_9ACTN
MENCKTEPTSSLPAGKKRGAVRANYNQWRSQAGLAAAREDADVRACMEEVLRIATFDLVPYEVVSVHRRQV